MNEWFDIYMEEVNGDETSIKNIVKTALTKPVDFMKEKWVEFKALLKEHEQEVCDAINRNMRTHITSFNDIDEASVQAINEEMMTESLDSFWKLAKQEAGGALIFWPILNVWTEIDKIIRGHGDTASNRTIIVYGLIWVTLVVAKHMHSKWQNNKEQQASQERREKLKKTIKPRIKRSIKKAGK